MLDSFTKKRIEKILQIYIDNKIPPELRNDIQILYKFRANTVTLSQERPGYMGGRFEYPIAQLRLEDTYWKVYWMDSKKKWHFIDDIEPHGNFETQLMKIDQSDMFWY
ncbi:DUF3024 domain-containing protein [Paenibacillus glycanilyticus]|uniref:DUF3024 domain-containing protein n=1 Tax=Paenibacillus glycanilyticus TaxID=126569 RepID=A0ABQ6G8P0_9BACL|nr:DUF3024 domain-containing protein [Paenibacillus glycanilyticus]GLX66635.1 hypothetical protein MU1_09790 [Paenibacillus glycanilyticus]